MRRSARLFVVLVLGAGSPTPVTPDDSLRAGNRAYLAGDWAVAERLYALAADRTTDPGLVAFNAAAVAVARGDYRTAELNYLRALDDADVPPGRRLFARYNRGVCLLQRTDSVGLRAAVQCFEQCLEEPLTDDAFRADVRHNLELAKLRWNVARAKQSQPPLPNEVPETEMPKPPPTRATEPSPAEPLTSSTTGSNSGSPMPSAGRPAAKGNPRPESGSAPPGMGTMPVLSDAAGFQKLTPEDTAVLLDQTDRRLKAARRQSDTMRGGPERPNVRDW